MTWSHTAHLLGALISIAAGGCCPPSHPQPSPPTQKERSPATSDLRLELSPTNLGQAAAGKSFALHVSLVNASNTNTVPALIPGANAWLGLAAPLYYRFDRKDAQGRWVPLPSSFFTGHPLRHPPKAELVALKPGARVELNQGVPPLEFPQDQLGMLRATLYYDVTQEAKRDENDVAIPANMSRTLVSNAVIVEQVPGALELIAEPWVSSSTR